VLFTMLCVFHEKLKFILHLYGLLNFRHHDQSKGLLSWLGLRNFIFCIVLLSIRKKFEL